jgi:hypothetical protein
MSQNTEVRASPSATERFSAMRLTMSCSQTTVFTRIGRVSFISGDFDSSKISLLVLYLDRHRVLWHPNKNLHVRSRSSLV